MTAPVTVSERDLRILTGIVSDHRDDLGAYGPPSLLADLMDQIRCDAVSFSAFGSARKSQWFRQDIPAPPFLGTEAWHEGPGCTGSTTGPASRAVTLIAPATCAAS